jgi:Arc/MetJ-type ribon-helix-helix transcriptional regulator
MDIVLPNDLADYVNTLVKREGYSDSSEVITAALRHFKAGRPARSIVMTPALERLLQEGMEDLHEAIPTSDLRGK